MIAKLVISLFGYLLVSQAVPIQTPPHTASLEPVETVFEVEEVKYTALEQKPVKQAPVKPQRVSSSGVEQWRNEVSKYDWNVETALAVMRCESGGNEKAINDNPSTGDYSVGLFQINLIGNLRQSRPAESWLLIGENNISYAYQMYSGQGWHPWTCFYKI